MPAPVLELGSIRVRVQVLKMELELELESAADSFQESGLERDS